MASETDRLLKLLRDFRDKRGWKKFHDPKNLAISVSIEAAELLEIFQWSNDDTGLDPRTRSRVADEAADVPIYTLMLFDALNLNPVEEALKKIDINEKRFPPEKIYGKPRLD